eukprot:737077-Alexandrium_andersonii.AAC.1
MAQKKTWGSPFRSAASHAALRALAAVRFPRMARCHGGESRKSAEPAMRPHQKTARSALTM